MKIYLLSAAGVIFLSVIVSLLVPEGKLNKTITFIMRLICIAVMIQPLTGIFKGEISSNGKTSPIDYEYVCNIYSEHQSRELEKLIEEELGADTDCKVTVANDNGEFKVTGVSVATDKNNSEFIESIYEYLSKLGYINISVYAEST